MWHQLEQPARLHLKVSVDYVDREVLWRCEQAIDAILSQSVDNERLLMVNFGSDGVLVIILDAMRLLADEISALFIDKKDNYQPMMVIQLPQVW